MKHLVNQDALEYWRHRTITRQELFNFCKEYDSKYFLSLFTFPGDGTLQVIASNRLGDSGEGHTVGCIRYFEEVLEKYQGPPLCGSIVLWHEDGMWAASQHSRLVPTLAFGRSRQDSYTFLIPDPAYMDSRGYREERSQAKKIDTETPFLQKMPTIFWRGAASGYVQSADWIEAPRLQLALLSKKINDPTVLNAGISSIPQLANPEHMRRIEKLDISAERRPFSDFLQYRYQIDIDGMSCAWMSCFRKLHADCVLFKVTSDLMQWYSPRMRPWKEYIPVDPKMSDLIDLYQWLEEDVEYAASIARNGTTLTESLDFEHSLQETGELLFEIFKTQTE